MTSFPDTKPVRLRAIQLLAGNNLRVLDTTRTLAAEFAVPSVHAHELQRLVGSVASHVRAAARPGRYRGTAKRGPLR